MFKKVAEIKYIQCISKSLEYYEHVDIVCTNYIPGICIAGKKGLIIKFKSLNKLNTQINFSNPDHSDFNSFLRYKSLKQRDITNRKLLDDLGTFFKAILISDPLNIYYYQIGNPDGRNVIPSLNYFKNKIDHTQYLMLSTTMTPEERTSEQCGLYIDRLWQVEFDHDEFMRLVNE